MKTDNGTAVLEPTTTTPAPIVKPTTIAAGLLVAQRALKEVGKTSKHDYLDYEYTSADDMMKACREALHQGGLHFSLTGHDLLPLPEISEVFSDPDVPPFIFVRSHFRLEHESGEFRTYQFDLPAIPEKGRPLDKAILGCMTTSTGYMLRDLLQAPRVDPNEVDKRDDSNVQAPRRAPKGPTWAEKKAGSDQQPPKGNAAAGEASAPPPTVKVRLWRAVGKWAKVAEGDADALAKAGTRVYSHFKMSTTGQASDIDLTKALSFVEGQIQRGTDFGEWAAAHDAAKEATKPATTFDINESDIPY